MDRPRITRWLRITWTVSCATVAVLLCVLWVRSYWYRDRLEGIWISEGLFNVWSVDGQFRLLVMPGVSGEWRFSTVKLDHWGPRREFQLGWSSNEASTVVYFPYWLVAIGICSFSMLPWLP